MICYRHTSGSLSSRVLGRPSFVPILLRSKCVPPCTLPCCPIVISDAVARVALAGPRHLKPWAEEMISAVLPRTGLRRDETCKEVDCFGMTGTRWSARFLLFYLWRPADFVFWIAIRRRSMVHTVVMITTACIGLSLASITTAANTVIASRCQCLS